MPSTFSSNLKIEIIPTGEQSGTWGITTNDNFSNVFETAIVGRVTIDYASDANKTITTANSVAAQDFRNVYLNLTSTVSLSATRELIVPTINKNYVVQNNTTGGQSITVKTSAGTGVTVPNGRTMAVYVNGTDVIAAFDYLPSMTLGAATISGNVSLGTTSANTLSIASTITSNLIFTDNTYDIGASGATRPRNLFLAGNATIGGNVGIGGTVTLGDNSADTISVNGTIVTNLIFTDNTYDIGASGATRPRTGYFGTSVITPSATISGLTSGRVPYASTGGLIVDSNNLTFNGTTLSVNTLSLTNALAVASGGTGNTAAPTAGALVYGNGTNYAFTTTGSAGQVLISNGAGAPTWTSIAISEAVGTLRYFEGSTTPPTGYIRCDGSVYAQATYPSLYAVVGTIPNNPYFVARTSNTTSEIFTLGELPNNNYMYGATGGFVGFSINGGITYTTISPVVTANAANFMADVLATNTSASWPSNIVVIAPGAQCSLDGVFFQPTSNNVFNPDSTTVVWAATDGTTLAYNNTSFRYYKTGNTSLGADNTVSLSGFIIYSAARFNSNTYVFVGSGGQIQTNTNITTTGATARTSGTTSTLFAVTVNTDSQFYVYGGAGGVLGTSTNGITWTVRTSGTTSIIRTLAYGNSLYAYGGDGGVLATSTDGITWTARTSGVTTTISKIVYGNGRFVAQTSNCFLTSTNGVTWVGVAPDLLSGSTVTGLAFASNFGFVAATSSTTILKSADGLVWQQYSSYTTNNIRYAGRTNSGYLYVDQGNRAFYGTGNLFTSAGSRTTTSIQYVAYTNNTYLYINTSNQGFVSTSRTGHKAAIPFNFGTVRSVIGGNGVFLVGSNTGVLYRSTDGANWTTVTSGTTSNITALAYENNIYLYGTVGGGLSTSTDGITWTARTSSTTAQINDFAYGASLYVGTLEIDGFVTSTDAITWTVNGGVYGPGSSANRFIVYAAGAGRFVANMPFNNALQTSTNGTTWSLTLFNGNSGVGTNGTTVNVLATSGSDSIAYTSTNGTTWTTSTIFIRGTTGTFGKLIYDGSNLVGGYSGGLGNSGTTMFSTDGLNWRFSGGVPQGGLSGPGAVIGGTVIFNVTANQPLNSIATSTDAGASWRFINTSGLINSSVNGVSAANNRFFAFLNAFTSNFFTSTDGITWSTVSTTGLPALLYANPIVYGNGIYVIAGPSGRIFTSTDYTNWTERNYPAVGNTIRALGFALGRFYLINSLTAGNQSSPANVYTSYDGINWTLTQLPITNATMNVFNYSAAANNLAVAGTSGTIIATRPITYDTTTQFAVPFQYAIGPTGNSYLYIKAS